MELNALKRLFKGFPSGSEVKTPSANAGDSGLVPGLRRFPGEGNGNPLQYSYPENSMDRGLLPQYMRLQGPTLWWFSG